MKNLTIKSLALAFFMLFFVACQSDSGLPKGMKEVNWDKDVCKRCNMIISERKFAVQVVNPKDDKAYIFDDLGCAVLWFEEGNLEWFDSAKIFINDAKTGEWIDAREALYLGDTKTPMNYGFSAFKKDNIDKNINYVSFDEAVKQIKSKGNNVNHEGHNH